MTSPPASMVSPRMPSSLCQKKTCVIIFDFITEFWEDKVDFEEWHEGQVVPVPKNGHVYDPNKWRGLKLMNIGAKVFISLICKPLFKIFKKNGVKYKFGSSPGVGCQDGTFTIKTILHTRHNHNLPSYAAFLTS